MNDKIIFIGIAIMFGLMVWNVYCLYDRIYRLEQKHNINWRDYYKKRLRGGKNEK